MQVFSSLSLTCTQACKYTHEGICTHTWACMRTPTPTQTCRHKHGHTRTGMCTHTQRHVHACRHTHTKTCTQACGHTICSLTWHYIYTEQVMLQNQTRIWQWYNIYQTHFHAIFCHNNLWIAPFPIHTHWLLQALLASTTVPQAKIQMCTHVLTMCSNV